MTDIQVRRTTSTVSHHRVLSTNWFMTNSCYLFTNSSLSLNWYQLSREKKALGYYCEVSCCLWGFDLLWWVPCTDKVGTSRVKAHWREGRCRSGDERWSSGWRCAGWKQQAPCHRSDAAVPGPAGQRAQQALRHCGDVATVGFASQGAQRSPHHRGGAAAAGRTSQGAQRVSHHRSDAAATLCLWLTQVRRVAVHVKNHAACTKCENCIWVSSHVI
jgi:hypothetical protein